MTERQEVAATPREAEVLPVYGTEQIDVDYARLLAQYKERSLFIDGVRKDSLAKTKPHHWLARKDTKGNVTLNLMGPGAERIKTNCPIGFVNVRNYEEKWTKEGVGAGYTVYYEAEVYVGTPQAGTLPVIGTCSSDDDFFSIEHSSLKYNADNPEHGQALENGEGRLSKDSKTLYLRRRIPASEVDRTNIVKSALMNLVVNGVTRVLGIRSIGEDELKDVGIDVNKIPTIEYGSSKEQSGRATPADAQKQSAIWDMLLEMNGGDDAKGAADLKKRTAFKDYAGTDDPQRLTAKQIGHHYPKIKADYDKFRGDSSKEKKDPQGKLL